MNNDRRPTTKNNTPRPDPSVQRQGARSVSAAPRKPGQPRSAGPNVKLTGSLNTGNFRVQNTGNFNKTAQPRPVRPPVENPSARRPLPTRPEPRRVAKKGIDDYLTWFLILALVLLIAVVVTYLIIKLAPTPDMSEGKLPSDQTSIEAGVNDPDNNETTVPEWTVVPSNLQAFVPKSTDLTAKIPSEKIHSAAAIMVDLKSGEVISELNPDTVIYPASLTKVMTAIVACELITDMKDTFELTNEIINPFVEQGATRANFYTNTPITMMELVYGAILPSGADACVGLAIKLCGSEEAFVAKMNEKAAAMGCTKTRFVNSTGLHDDGHYSSVRDLANMLSYAMNNPFLRTVLSAISYTTTAPLGNEYHGFYYTLNCIWSSRYNSNDKSSKAAMFAAKTGYTVEAGQCLASVSRSADGSEYVIVTVGAKTVSGEESRSKPYSDVKYLLDTYLD